MLNDSFVFGYIKAYYSKALERLKKSNVVFFYGESRIGKTYLAQLCMGKESDKDYYKLYLKAYDGYNPSYYSFLLGLEQSDRIFEIGKEIVTDAINSINTSDAKVVAKIIEYASSFKRKFFPYLNESEILIINRINFHCKNRPLFLVVDDYEKWDEASKKLLRFFLTSEAQNTIPFLNKCKIIIIGENENCIEEIKEQITHIPSVHIEGCKLQDSFVDEFSRITSCSDVLAKTLFQITNGNLGMAYDLKLYMDEDSSFENISFDEEDLKAKEIFFSLINERVNQINQNMPQFTTTIKAASIQGMMFEQKYLPYVVDENEFSIERVLSVAKDKRFLKIIYNKNALYSFINNYIYQYFENHYNEYKKEYHYKFAYAAKKIHPSDYYTQYLHLRAADKFFEASENLVIHLIRLKLKNGIVDSSLLDYLNQSSEALYNDYQVIAHSIDSHNNGMHKEALIELELVTPISEMILQEKEYLTAYFIYDSWIYERNAEACDILENNFASLLDSNFDMWLRSSLLLYIFYVNRLHNELEAKKVEKKVMKEIAKRYRDDSSLEIIVQILNRNSSALYSVEVAQKKIEKSVAYFESFAHVLPREYMYTLTNYSGLLLVASEYEKGFQSAKKAISFIAEKKIWFIGIEKLINNYLVNGVMSHNITCNEAVEICNLLMDNTQFHKKVLLKNNYYIFKALAGDVATLSEEIKELFWSNSVQKHNDYYVYLIGTNYMCVAIVLDDLKTAKHIYTTLDEMIPAICSNEEYIIRARYKIFKEIIENQSFSINSFEDLEVHFRNSLADISSDYAKIPYIFTDQQFWSVI